MIRATSIALLSALALCAGGCATRAKQYSAPDPGKLNTSTARVAKAVNEAHDAARAAKTNVDEAIGRQKEIETEISAIADVPPTLRQKINDQDKTLGEASVHQQALEEHLTEADIAKADAQNAKDEYFAASKTLADDATNERNKRIADEKALSWYRWHWWGSWIVLGLGVVACGLIAFLKFTGKLALAGAAISAKIP